MTAYDGYSGSCYEYSDCDYEASLEPQRRVFPCHGRRKWLHHLLPYWGVRGQERMMKVRKGKKEKLRE